MMYYKIMDITQGQPEVKDNASLLLLPLAETVRTLLLSMQRLPHVTLSRHLPLHLN